MNIVKEESEGDERKWNQTKENYNCKQAQSETKTLNHNPNSIQDFTKYSKGMNIGVYEIPHDFI